MRTQEELKSIIFGDWTREEIVRAAIAGDFPKEAETRLRNLENLLPMLDAKLQEEVNAIADVKKNNSRDPYVKEWEAEIAELQDLITRGLALGAKHQLWHRKGAKCPKCEEELQHMERSVCLRCKGGRQPM